MERTHLPRTGANAWLRRLRRPGSFAGWAPHSSGPCRWQPIEGRPPVEKPRLGQTHEGHRRPVGGTTARSGKDRPDGKTAGWVAYASGLTPPRGRLAGKLRIAILWRTKTTQCCSSTHHRRAHQSAGTGSVRLPYKSATRWLGDSASL
jgi:hypothetical protein